MERKRSSQELPGEVPRSSQEKFTKDSLKSERLRAGPEDIKLQNGKQYSLSVKE